MTNISIKTPTPRAFEFISRGASAADLRHNAYEWATDRVPVVWTDDELSGNFVRVSFGTMRLVDDSTFYLVSALVTVTLVPLPPVLSQAPAFP
jgi:hypothetical protein